MPLFDPGAASSVPLLYWETVPMVQPAEAARVNLFFFANP